MCVCFDLYLLTRIVFFVSIYSPVSVLILHAMNLAFAKIPIGGHTVCACVAMIVVTVLNSILMRNPLATIVPFEVIFVVLLSSTMGAILYGTLKFIPVKDERTGQTKRWAIGTTALNLYLYSNFITITQQCMHSGTWLHMPASHRFDLKSRTAVKRNAQTSYEFMFRLFVSKYCFKFQSTDTLLLPSV